MRFTFENDLHLDWKIVERYQTKELFMLELLMYVSRENIDCENLNGNLGVYMTALIWNACGVEKIERYLGRVERWKKDDSLVRV